MITDEQKRELENIVGPKWVNASAAMADTFCIHRHSEWLTRGTGSEWLPRPAAVVMPETAQEISEIIKYCNTTNLMVKPVSTGWCPQAAVSRDGVLLLDLKRMNRILDFDPKNQIAVVEPYVKAIRLQTLAWKHGLNCQVISAGGNHSILASVTSAWGYNWMGPSNGYSGRNLLGAEWVLPSGEILTSGSGGEGKGWFCPEGPGPSLRGILRGHYGSFGGLGVFTKCAVKLNRWDGYKTLDVVGSNPHFSLRDMPPKNVDFFAVSFPSEQALADGGYKLGEADINYSDFRVPAAQFAWMACNEDRSRLEEVWKTGFFQKTSMYVLVLSIVGHSQREFDWKLAALNEICRELGAIKMPLDKSGGGGIDNLLKIANLTKSLKDPFKLLRKFPRLQGLMDKMPVDEEAKREMFSNLFLAFLRHASNTQGGFPMPNCFFTVLGSFDGWDKGIAENHWSAENVGKYVKSGGLVDMGDDAGMGGTYEGGHLGYFEPFGMYRTNSKKSKKAFSDYGAEAIDASISEALGIPLHGQGHRMNFRYGPLCYDYHKWMLKIKETLDPNTASDPYFYIDPNAPEESDREGVM